MSNNFNQSSTGVNIEESIFYDNDMSSINFNENIEQVRINGHEYFLYINYGNLNSDICIDDLLTFDTSSLDLDAQIQLDNDLSYMDLEETINTLESHDIPYTKHYTMITVTGYSQGDNGDVIVMHKLKEVWGVKQLDMDSIKEDLANYFYNTPLRAIVTINDEEYPLDELDGYYNFDYDKEEVIKALIHDTPDSIDKVALRAELDKVIPTEPKYY